MDNISALLRLSTIETKLFFREKQAVFWTFLFPILMIWLFGEMFGKTQVAGMSYSDAYVPSWIAVNILTTALFTIGTTLSAYRQMGVMRRLMATPVRPWVVLAAHMVYGMIIFFISAMVMVIFGVLLFHLDMPKYPANTVLALLLSVLRIFPFGFLMPSLEKNVRTASAISSLLLNLMLFLSGATFPLAIMPRFLQGVAKVLPLYYVIDLLRNTWNFTPIASNMTDVWVLLFVMIASSALAAKFFRWDAS